MVGGSGSYREDASAVLRMQAALLNEVVAHLAATLPNEGVGLIAVVPGPVAHRAVAFFPGTSLDHSPTRYTMDPAEVLDAFREMGANGWSLGAIAHSHPRSAPIPSPTDLREAFYPDALMLIIGFADGDPAVRLWRIVSEGKVPEAREAHLIIDLE